MAAEGVRVRVAERGVADLHADLPGLGRVDNHRLKGERLLRLVRHPSLALDGLGGVASLANHAVLQLLRRSLRHHDIVVLQLLVRDSVLPVLWGEGRRFPSWTSCERS